MATVSMLAMAGAYRGANSYILVADGTSQGTVWSHGDGGYATASGTNGTNAAPYAMPAGVSRFIDIAGFTGGMYALANTGDVYATGFNTGLGSLGDGVSGTHDTRDLVKVLLPSGVKAVQLSASYTGGIVLGDDGFVYTWGVNDEGDCGQGAVSNSINIPGKVVDSAGTPISNILMIRGRFKGGVALTKDGHVWSWGDNRGGNLGQGYESSAGAAADPHRYDCAKAWKVMTSAGVYLSGVNQIPRFYHEAYHSFAWIGTRKAGHLYSWGYGSYYVHDSASQANRSFAAINGYDGAIQTLLTDTTNGGPMNDMALSYYGCHILLGSTAYNWGYGIYGQGGDGTTNVYLQNLRKTMLASSHTTPASLKGFFPCSHGGIIGHK